MNEREVVRKTEIYVKDTLATAEGGHDWWHTDRVRTIALKIAKGEGGVNLYIVELGALLHDIADAKFHNGDEEIGPKVAREFLVAQTVDRNVIEHVENIVRNVSFKNSFDDQSWMSPELAVVQDADRLDALGAIGLARAFSYGGFRERPLYDPHSKPNPVLTKAEYKKSVGPTLNHIYEKVLRLRDMMNTNSGRRIAVGRHRFVETYLEQFHAEWEGER